MFCNQCQETAMNTGCTIAGVCGKKDYTAKNQDLLIYASQGLSFATIAARAQGIDTNVESKQIVQNLFMTITNANFDDALITKAIKATLQYRDALKTKINISETNDAFLWNGESAEELQLKAETVGILTYDTNEDIRSLKQYTLYGIKGLAAYTEHAFNLGYEDNSLYAFIEETLVKITQPISLEDMLAWVMKTGEHGVKVMALLDQANTSTYGNPEITKVNIGVGKNPGILVSGHDLKDLEQLLIQTEGTGIDIYTHSEMLPSHAYPFFKQYKHLVGNYGNA